MKGPERFELTTRGGIIRQLDLPWGALAGLELPAALRAEAREVWTRMAFVEYRTAAGMNAVAETLIAARAPLDLTALASSFAFDELGHAELCSRVVDELGGATPLFHHPHDLIWPRPPMRLAPLVRAAEMVVRVFCVAEAFALPIARIAARQSADLPLIDGVLRHIADDEIIHASFGWTFLDWASEWLTDGDRVHLARAAQEAIDFYRGLVRERSDERAPTLGWLSDRDFKAYGERALLTDVLAPLRRHGIEVH